MLVDDLEKTVTVFDSEHELEAYIATCYSGCAVRHNNDSFLAMTKEKFSENSKIELVVLDLNDEYGQVEIIKAYMEYSAEPKILIVMDKDEYPLTEFNTRKVTPPEYGVVISYYFVFYNEEEYALWKLTK